MKKKIFERVFNFKDFTQGVYLSTNNTPCFKI